MKWDEVVVVSIVVFVMSGLYMAFYNPPPSTSSVIDALMDMFIKTPVGTVSAFVAIAAAAYGVSKKDRWK